MIGILTAESNIYLNDALIFQEFARDDIGCIRDALLVIENIK